MQTETTTVATPRTTVLARIPLTIRVSYLPDWGAFEGVRELIQNWLDAKDASGDGSYEYNQDEAAIVLHNKGTIDRSVLLLGTTSKADGSARGQFGEGLKLGTLALVRLGMTVTLLAGREKWVASIEESADFAGQQVLTWTIYEEPTRHDGVTLRIEGVDPDLQALIQKSFVTFVDDLGACASGFYGTILLDPKWKGKVFVKGILVQDFGAEQNRLTYGYNLTRARVDRDRRLVSDWDLESHAGALLAEAEKSKAIETSALFDAILSGARDASGSSYHVYGYSNSRRYADVFSTRYGEDALPTAKPEYVEAGKKLGVKFILVPKPLYDILAQSLGKDEDALNNARAKVKESNRALPTTVVKRIEWAKLQLASACEDAEFDVAVVDFVGDLEVAIDPASSTRVLVSRRATANRSSTLNALVRGLSLLYGASGTKTSEADIYRKLVDFWHTDKRA